MYSQLNCEAVTLTHLTKLANLGAKRKYDASLF